MVLPREGHQDETTPPSDVLPGRYGLDVGAIPQAADFRPPLMPVVNVRVSSNPTAARGRSQLDQVAIQASISLSSPCFRPSGRKLAVTELRANRAITSSLKPNVARRAS
jgi:hypothetical protein